MTTDTPIKTRPDGSIDTTFYIQKGRLARSEAAHELIKPRSKPLQTPKHRSGFGWFGRKVFG